MRQTHEEGRRLRRPWFVVIVPGASDKRRLALPIRDEQVVADFRRQSLVLVLEPDQLSFQVAYSLLKAAHL
jgi:DNA polymerase II small subunit/DNA polymerase delta subunit B